MKTLSVNIHPEISINGRKFRLATLKEIFEKRAFWSGQCYLVEI